MAQLLPFSLLLYLLSCQGTMDPLLELIENILEMVQMFGVAVGKSGHAAIDMLAMGGTKRDSDVAYSS